MNGKSKLQWIYTENHIALGINALCNYVTACMACVCLTPVPWLSTFIYLRPYSYMVSLVLTIRRNSCTP